VSEHRVTFKLGDYLEVYGNQLVQLKYIFVHELDLRRMFAVVCPIIDFGLGRDKILDLPLVVQTQDQRIVGLSAIEPKHPYLVDLGPTAETSDRVEQSGMDGGRVDKGQGKGDSRLVHCNWELHFL